MMADPNPKVSGAGAGKPKITAKYHGPSPVWKYFNLVKLQGIKKGQCKACGKICSCADGSTSGMRSHLQAFHPEDFNAVNADTIMAMKEKERLDREADDFIGEFGPIGASKKKAGAMSNENWRVGDQRQQLGDMAVMKLIAANNLSFNFVDTPGFHEFMETTLPGFNLKHSSTYAKYKLPLLHVGPSQIPDTEGAYSKDLSTPRSKKRPRESKGTGSGKKSKRS